MKVKKTTLKQSHTQDVYCFTTYIVTKKLRTYILSK